MNGDPGRERDGERERESERAKANDGCTHART